MLSVHYRSPINFTASLLESAKNSFDRIKTSYQNLEHRKATSLDLEIDNSSWFKKIEEHEVNFETAMNDDFNTANAITVLFDLAKDANLYLKEKQTNSKVIVSFQEKLVKLLDVLGINLDDATPELLDDEIDGLIVERDEARDTKNYERADEIRDLLHEKKIILEDTPQGVRWKRG